MAVLFGFTMRTGLESFAAFFLLTTLQASGIVGGNLSYRDWEKGERETLGWHSLGMGVFLSGWASLSAPPQSFGWAVMGILVSWGMAWPARAYRVGLLGIGVANLFWFLGALGN